MQKDVPAATLNSFAAGLQDSHSKFPLSGGPSQDQEAPAIMKNVPHLAPHNFFQPRMSDLEAQHHFRHANPSDLGCEFPQTTFTTINGPNLSNGHEPHPNTMDAERSAGMVRPNRAKVAKDNRAARRRALQGSMTASMTAQDRQALNVQAPTMQPIPSEGVAKLEAGKVLTAKQKLKREAKKLAKEEARTKRSLMSEAASSFQPAGIPGLSLLTPTESPLPGFMLPPLPTSEQLSGPGSKRYGQERVLAMQRPQPTHSYLEAVARGHHRLIAPRPLLIVLDLNGVLVRRRGRGTAFDPRPDLDAFLDYIFTHHHVMVWSSGMPANVLSICQRVFTPAQFSALIAIWGRDTLRIPSKLFRENVQVYKQLSWIWQSPLQSRASAPTALCNGAPGWYDQTNTVLIDDTLEKGIAEPYNLLQVQEYLGGDEVTAEGGQGILSQTAAYLNQMAWANDVSAFLHSAAVQRGQQWLKIEAEDQTSAMADLLAKTDASEDEQYSPPP